MLQDKGDQIQQLKLVLIH